MSSIIQLNRGSVGNNPCPLCNTIHVPQNKCSSDVLAKRVALLLEANKIIPNLLRANKEAVDSARTFQNMIKDTTKFIDLVKDICHKPEYVEVGAKIWAEVMFVKAEDVEQCQDKETLNLDTDKEKDSSQESLILSATEGSNSTGAMILGENSPESSLK